MARTIRVVLSMVVGVLVVAIAGGTWWAARYLDPESLRARAEAALTATLGRPVVVERVEVRPWLGRASLLGVRTTGASTGEGVRSVALGRAEATLGLASFWRREVIVSPLRLHDLDVSLGFDGGPSAAFAVPDRIALGPVTAVIRSIELHRARLELANPTSSWTVRIDVGRAVVAHRHLPEPGADGRERDLEIALAVPSVRVTQPGLTESIEDLEATAQVRSATLTVERLTARWRGERVQVTGTVSDLTGTPTMALTVQGALSLAALADVGGWRGPISGRATVEARVTGPAVTPAVAGMVAAPELTAATVTARKVQGRFAWRDGHLTLEDVTSEMLGGAVRASLDLAPDRPSTAHVVASFSRLSLAAVGASVATPTGLGGHVSGEVDLRGDPARLSDVAGRVRLDSDDLLLPDVLVGLGPGRAEVEARVTGGVAHVERGSGMWKSVRVEKLSGGLTRDGPRDLAIVARADLAALARLMGESRVSGHTTVSATLGGRWDRPSVDARARSDSITIAGVVLRPVDFPLQIRGANGKILGASGVLGQSRLEVSGTLSLPQPLVASLRDVTHLREAARFSVTFRAPRLRLVDLAAWVPPGWGRTGHVTLLGQVAGSLASWRGAGTFDAREVSLGERIVEKLAGKFVIDQHGLEVVTPPAAPLAHTRSGDGLPRRRGGGFE